MLQTRGNNPGIGTGSCIIVCLKIAKERKQDDIIVMNLCGRGDKDIFTVADALGVSI